MKTEIILKYIGGQKMFGLGTLRFDEKSFFHTLLGFTPYWDYKPSNSSGVYSSDKILNLNIINKIYLKCDVFDGSIQDGVRQPILFSFVLDKPSGYKVFCDLKQLIIGKKLNLF